VIRHTNAPFDFRTSEYSHKKAQKETATKRPKKHKTFSDFSCFVYVPFCGKLFFVLLGAFKKIDNSPAHGRI
jgi:hypothetical protein